MWIRVFTLLLIYTKFKIMKLCITVEIPTGGHESNGWKKIAKLNQSVEKIDTFCASDWQIYWFVYINAMKFYGMPTILLSLSTRHDSSTIFLGIRY